LTKFWFICKITLKIYEEETNYAYKKKGKKKTWISKKDVFTLRKNNSQKKKEEKKKASYSVKGLFLRAIKVYQGIKFIFPLQCKFIPSCSQYAKEVLLKYPLRKALGKIFLRIIRCHPLSKGGVDLP